MKVLVTGANGQLGQALRDWEVLYPDMHFSFLTKNDLDITNSYKIEEYFSQNSYDVVINTAAYTNVDGAESSQELATLVNATSLEWLAKACSATDTILIHISTDYVFPGNTHVPYTEEDDPDPINYYGETKLAGEVAMLSSPVLGAIIRTSWLFGFRGNNFVKKILKLASQKAELKVVSDQIGAPTYAVDLAKFILDRVQNQDFLKPAEIYNYTNSGIASWYDLASISLSSYNRQQNCQKRLECNILPTSSQEFPTPALRPSFSLLDLKKIQREFEVVPAHWSQAVAEVTSSGSLID